MGLYAFNDIVADIELWLDNKRLLRDEGIFNVGELALQLHNWAATGAATDFRYNCADTDEQDWFTLRRSGTGFHFLSTSEYVATHVTAFVEREAVLEFISRFCVEVKEKIKQELGLDAAGFI
ncbi:hypothetical protein GCM10027175_34220 [Hymenobacter latericoloratus]